MPWWKRRLNAQIKELRKEISKLEVLKGRTLKSEATEERLWNKYKVKQKGLRTVMEELKQRVTAKSKKIKRYQGRVNQYRQNRMYCNNQKMFFERLDKDKSNDVIPDGNETKTVWKKIGRKKLSITTGQSGSNQLKTKFMIRHTSSITIVFLLNHSEVS